MSRFTSYADPHVDFPFEITTECGGCKNLTADQRIRADMLYWMRSATRGLEDALKNRVLVGPKGHMDRKKRWFPHPVEACDAHIGQGWEPDDAEHRFSPWLWYKHCKTLEHCEYLSVHREPYVRILLSEARAQDLIKLVQERAEDIPLLINKPIKEEITRRFIKAFLAGDVFPSHRYLPDLQECSQC